MNVLEYLTKLRSVRDRIQDETESIIYKKENEIIRLNTQQIDDFIGSDGSVLKNSDIKFKGTYTLATALINPEKKAGNRYNFLETGDFFKGFFVDVSSDLTKVTINSTGTGFGDKADFFKGYKNIFGLTKENQLKLNYDIILPELQKFIKTNLV